MNDRRTSSLPPDVEAALGAERARPGVGPEARARALARIQASLLAGGGGDGSGGSEPALPRTPRPPGSRRSLWKALGRMHPGLTAVVGFAVGMTTGVAMHARLAARPPEAPTVGRADRSVASVPVPATGAGAGGNPSVAAPVGSSVAAPAPPEVHAAAPSRDAPVASATSESAPPVPSASTLTAERALLDIAHSALGKGQAAEALGALGQHAQRFPRGVYREEREALAIQCLRALGRTDEAARHATAFRARYPKSLFLAVVGRETNP